MIVGRAKQNCCPVCRKGGVCKLNKCVQFIMMLVISVDGGKVWALQSRLCSGRLSSFSKGEAGHPKSRQASQTKSGAVISPEHTFVQGFSSIADLLPGSICTSSADILFLEGIPKTPLCKQGSACALAMLL